jgi:curved DNA-binding protein CbpA
MNSGESPFEILSLSSSAEPEVIDAAHRAMARQYHPDLNPGVALPNLNARMVRINWARDQLKTNYDYWYRQPPGRGRATAGRQSASGTARSECATDGRAPTIHEHTDSEIPSQHLGVVTVHPTLLNLTGRKGSRGQFEASAGTTRAADIRARFSKSALIDLE